MGTKGNLNKVRCELSTIPSGSSLHEQILIHVFQHEYMESSGKTVR